MQVGHSILFPSLPLFNTLRHVYTDEDIAQWWCSLCAPSRSRIIGGVECEESQLIPGRGCRTYCVPGLILCVSAKWNAWMTAMTEVTFLDLNTYSIYKPCKVSTSARVAGGHICTQKHPKVTPSLTQGGPPFHSARLRKFGIPCPWKHQGPVTMAFSPEGTTRRVAAAFSIDRSCC
jgi:hypothetical protein